MATNFDELLDRALASIPEPLRLRALAGSAPVGPSAVGLYRPFVRNVDASDECFPHCDMAYRLNTADRNLIFVIGWNFRIMPLCGYRELFHFFWALGLIHDPPIVNAAVNIASCGRINITKELLMAFQANIDRGPSTLHATLDEKLLENEVKSLLSPSSSGLWGIHPSSFSTVESLDPMSVEVSMPKSLVRFGSRAVSLQPEDDDEETS